MFQLHINVYKLTSTLRTPLLRALMLAPKCPLNRGSTACAIHNTNNTVVLCLVGREFCLYAYLLRGIVSHNQPAHLLLPVK